MSQLFDSEDEEMEYRGTLRKNGFTKNFPPAKTGSGFTKEKQNFQSTEPRFHPTIAAKLDPGLTTQRTRDKMAQTNHRSWITVPPGPNIALIYMATKPTWNHIILRKK